jgi:hypothetical protein
MISYNFWCESEGRVLVCGELGVESAALCILCSGANCMIADLKAKITAREIVLGGLTDFIQNGAGIPAPFGEDLGV